jgi:hypothetical protein
MNIFLRGEADTVIAEAEVGVIKCQQLLEVVTSKEGTLLYAPEE